MPKINKKINSNGKKPKELDLGERKVSRMNFSNIVTLPKTFTQNSLCGENMAVKMTMLEDGCLKLTPVCSTKKTGGESK